MAHAAIHVEVSVAAITTGQGTREKLILKTIVEPSAIVWHLEDTCILDGLLT